MWLNDQKLFKTAQNPFLVGYQANRNNDNNLRKKFLRKNIKPAYHTSLILSHIPKSSGE